MPTTLAELVTAVRAEIGDSTNMSMGIDSLPAIRQTIKRVQETYYMDYDWPHLIIDRDEEISAGERFYTFNSDVNFDRIFGSWVRDNDMWIKMDYGVDPEHYNSSDPDLLQSETVPTRWTYYENNQFEVWPTPSQNGRIRFRCVKALPPLINDDDVCVLDANLIILTTAAEMLARSRSEDAQLKFSLANNHYQRIKGRLQKTRMFEMGKSPYASTKPRNWTVRAPRN